MSSRITASNQLVKLWGLDQTKGTDKSRLESTQTHAELQCQYGIQQHEDTDVFGMRPLEYRTQQPVRPQCWTRVDVCCGQGPRGQAGDCRLLTCRCGTASDGSLTNDKGTVGLFGLDRAFSNEIDTGRVIPLEGTTNGWSLTVDLEASDEANRELQ